MVWRVCGGDDKTAGLAAGCAVTLGGFVLCFQIIHLKTPGNDLWKVREPFPQHLHPGRPRTVCT